MINVINLYGLFVKHNNCLILKRHVFSFTKIHFFCNNRNAKFDTLKSSYRIIKRFDSQFPYRMSRDKKLTAKNKTVAIYAASGVIVVLALTYAAVPLYRIYCQTTGKGGRPFQDLASEKIENMQKVNERIITVKFNADSNSTFSWNFKPTQSELKVAPGETALAFYTARNPLDIPINGVSTYSVIPFEAGQYLNKIQCFCFEEQRLNPNEEVDMPVFFYIDPEYADDPRLENINEIVLSYTFFQAKEGFKYPFLMSPKQTTVV